MYQPTPYMIANAYREALVALQLQAHYPDLRHMGMVFSKKPYINSSGDIEFEMEYKIFFAFLLLIQNGLPFLTDSDLATGHLSFYFHTLNLRSEGNGTISLFAIPFQGKDCTEITLCEFVTDKLVHVFKLFDRYVGCVKTFSISS